MTSEISQLDVEDRERAESLLTGEKEVLEMVARGAAVSDVLTALCRLVELITPDCSCSILLVDPSGTRLTFGAAPSLPAPFIEAVMSLPLNSESGACATAVCQRQQVIAADISSEIRWKSSGWSSVALKYGMQACWSTPICASNGAVLGSFALLYPKPRTPTSLHQSLIDRFTHIASITVERARNEETLATLQSELAHMARVTAMGALTASIAHEVNQPLSGIITNASTCLRMLAADPPNLDGARETARRTIRDGHRAADVITRLRSLFGKQEPAIETVDLNDATREVITLLRCDLQRNQVLVRTALADDLPPVRGDRVQLQQVVLNLLRNASDAMNRVDDRARLVFITTERDAGDRVRLTVEDSGEGFDAASAERLFDAFYTTKGEGMGIGLAVSRSIIESHNGRLWAAPNDGPGATFSFSIPVGSDRERMNLPVESAHLVGTA